MSHEGYSIVYLDIERSCLVKYLNDLYQQIGEEAEESKETSAPTDMVDVWEEMTP